jgi:hypothetical protein
MLLLNLRQRVVEQRSLSIVVLELGSQDSVLDAADRRLVVRVRPLLGSVLRSSVVPVREVRGLVLVDVSSVLAVPVVESEGTGRLVDGDLVVVDTETRDLRVLVGEVSPREQRVVGKVDTGNNLATGSSRSASTDTVSRKPGRTWVVQNATCSVSVVGLSVSTSLSQKGTTRLTGKVVVGVPVQLQGTDVLDGNDIFRHNLRAVQEIYSDKYQKTATI